MPSFVRQMNRLEADLTEEVFDRIELFKDTKNHQLLKVHKLHGELAGQFSFSVDYKIRIVFKYLSKNEVVLLVIGDHDIYR